MHVVQKITFFYEKSAILFFILYLLDALTELKKDIFFSLLETSSRLKKTLLYTKVSETSVMDLTEVL